MPIDLVGDVQRVTVAARYTDEQVEETNINFRCSVAGGADTRSLLGLAVYGYFVGNYAAVMSNRSSLYGFKISSVNKAPAMMPVYSVDLSLGILDELYVPTQARPILRLRTDMAGKRYRGRMYLFSPGISGINEDGYPTNDVADAANTLGTALIAPQTVGGSTWLPVIAHLITGDPTGTTTTDVTSRSFSHTFGTIRKSGNTGRLNDGPW